MSEQGHEQYQVVATEPMLIDKPLRRLRRIRVAIVLAGVAIVVCAFAAAYVGYSLSSHDLRSQVAALNASRATNRAQLQQQQADTQAQVQQGLALLCAVLQRIPPDAEMDYLRMFYHCGPYLPPGDPRRQHVVLPTSPPASPPATPSPSS